MSLCSSRTTADPDHFDGVSTAGIAPQYRPTDGIQASSSSVSSCSSRLLPMAMAVRQASLWFPCCSRTAAMAMKSGHVSGPSVGPALTVGMIRNVPTNSRTARRLDLRLTCAMLRP